MALESFSRATRICLSIKVFLRETATDYINSNYSEDSQNARFAQEYSRTMRAAHRFWKCRSKQRCTGHVDCQGTTLKVGDSHIASTLVVETRNMRVYSIYFG
jgi:hypothetical protein